ncbi:MAG: ACT domain-containing protein [Polyangia bacterium]|jgi:ACT domain-containing protein
MPRVISHTEVEALSEGATLTVEPDALVTPLALERAREKGVTVARDPAPTEESLIEAVVAKLVGSLGGSQAELTEVGPGIDFCQMCLEQERSRARSRAVLTTTGKNQKGIVARVTGRIADLGGDILDISQTLVGDYFTMIIVVDTASLDVPFASFKETLEAEIHEMGLQCMMMHEDVVSSLHRI